MKSNYFNKKLLPNFKTLGLLFFTVLLFSACDKDDPLPPNTGKKPAETLTFQKFTQPFSSDKIKATDILAKVQGEKGGYTLKEIKDITPKNVVTITGKAPNFIITINKAGTVTATIVLQHKNKKDATITKATIEITKATAENLTFQKVRKAFISGGSFATADILAGVQGTKTGYILKSITNITPSNVASVQGTAPAILLNMLKIGSFTATITLENPNKTDATITGAQFEITKTAAPTNLTFSKLTKTFDSGAKFTSADILAGVQGTKTGYTLKSINAVSPSGVANASGSAPNIVLNITKAGTFTATIILQHNEKADVTITNCQFEITKGDAEKLTFQKITKKFTRGGTIDNVKIMSHIQGNKTGYTLKSITELAPNNVAGVTGTAPNLALTMTKLGAFSATITLQHNDKKDAIITGAQFELSTKTVENLTFTKRTKAFATGGSFSVADILAGVQGNKTGFTIKNITVSSNIVTVTSSKALNFGSRAGNFTATIILQHSTKADVTITNCKFEITKLSAPTNLSFTKRTKTFTSGGSFTTVEILEGVQGTKTGYTIKDITTISPDIVTFNSSTKALHFKNSVGTFTATIILEHNTKADVTITNCDFEITRANAETLSFTKITKKFTSGGTIDNAKIMSHITGNKTGYTLKSITALNPTGVASESGTVPNIYLSMTKVGTFTATITLEHSTKQDATIRNCEFELTAKTVENLTFSKISKAFATGGSFSVADILAGVQGNKTGFTIKSITDLSSNIVTVSPAKALNFGSRAGNFTATIILQHSTKADVTITNCQFEITKRNAENLTFTKRSKAFVSGGKFSVADILGGVRGTKTGYTVKNISNLSSNIVTVSSTKTLDFKNLAGAFTATIILQHSTKADVTIENCEFEISKNPAPTDFSFTKIIKQYDSGNRFTTNDILGAISGSKTNYTLKSITVSPSGIAVVSGTAPNLSLTMTKAGNFTATIILEHPTKRNVSIPSCEFEITKLTAPTLTWTKQTKAFASGGEITNANLLAGLTGADADKRGYTIKTVTITDADGTSARVDGSGTSAKITSYKKVGTLTLSLVFEHSTKKDVTLTGKLFEITKAAAETLNFRKVSKAFTSGGKFSTADILGGVRGTKTGYTIKNITDLNPNNLVRFSASKELDFSGGLGSFTATIILEHPTKKDTTITRAEFEVTKAVAEILTFEKVYKVFATSGSFSTAEILASVQGTKDNYTIKSISTISPNDVANVTGTAPAISINMAKQGDFTATIVLQHPAKQDATITGAAFQIYSDKLQVSNDGKVSLKSGTDKASITSMVIPAKMGNTDVTAIGSRAFLDCTNLTSVTIPNSVKTIENVAFARCTKLTSVTIPNFVTSIEYSAFWGCTSLSSITIPNSVTSIGNSIFKNCTNLTSVTIGDSVTSIGNSIFKNCTNLTSVTIADSVTAIGDNAFYGCTSLSSITIPNSVTSIGDNAFYGCTSLSSITIPNSVTSIGNSIFKNCTNLTSVTIGDSVTSIEFYPSFYENCTNLTSVTIPNSVTSIGNRAFFGCSSLTSASVTIPSSVTSIGNSRAFGNCGNLSINRPSLQITKEGVIYSILDITGNLNIPSKIKGITVTSIGNSAFLGCSNLTSVTIPNSIMDIGRSAFSGCTSLSSITIPNSVRDIGRSPFYGCTSLTEIQVPSAKKAVWEIILKMGNNATVVGY